MSEHDAMLSCRHDEPDQLGPLCLFCGRVEVDPSYVILGLALAYLAIQVARYFL